MKIKKLFLSILTVGMLFTATNLPAFKSPIHSVTVFSGSIMLGNVKAQFMEYYINHQEQRQVIPITYDGEGKATYYVAIPMTGVEPGSTVAFKINEQVFGFARLDGTRQALDLAADEQSH